MSPTELKEAEEFWIKRCQFEAFPNGVKEPCLTRLTPTKDVNGLLRVNGRLARAESLSFEAKFPLLLPKKHPLTRLIVQNAHETLGHGTGVEHTLTELRARFWIVKGRRVVRDIVSSCKECPRKFSVQTTGQVMAPLPKERLQSLRAFDNVGIDFAGPFLTKQGRGKSRAKRYLCLFTCLATRAVHLEMTYHLDTDSFVNAFTRMTSRRGTPSYVITDNGTNFVGAEREIRGLVQRLEQNKIIEMTGNYQPIEWKFNPPSAPHFGGVFEAMVKSAKRAIKAILGNAEIDDEELHTAICGAEKLLNSRPITYVSSDPQDLTPLTPNHFLVGEVGGIFAPEAMDKVEAYHPVKRWHRVQQLLQHFWKRWQREFLPQLNLRKKWFHPRHNIAVGDVVLVAEPRNNRGEWPLARIVEVFPDENGMVRVVKLWSNGKEFKRPVHRLCPLEYVDQKDDA